MMTTRRLRLLPAVLLALACSPALAKKAAPSTPPAPTVPAPGRPTTPSPSATRAQQLREAADLLDKAAAALAKGQKSFAEQLFSAAELIVGEGAVADLAPLYREGAPPRVTTPLKTVPDAGAQPKVVGNSDADEPAKKPERGSMTGQVMIDGKPLGGFGVVTLEPLGRKWKPRVPKTLIMEQRGREFLPHVMAVPVGSTVTFPNYDAIFHNVFSASAGKSFDLGLYKGGQARDVVFDKEGIVRVGCNLHANMSGYVIVVSAPHYVITGEDGAFKFGSLAPGKYKLRAWSERSAKPVEQEVVVKAGGNSVTVGVAADAPSGPTPDKFGVARGQKP